MWQEDFFPAFLEVDELLQRGELAGRPLQVESRVRLAGVNVGVSSWPVINRVRGPCLVSTADQVGDESAGLLGRGDSAKFAFEVEAVQGPLGCIFFLL